MPSERISLIVDVVTGNSKRALSSLKTDLAAADGAGAKLKVGAKALGDSFKQNLGVIGPAAAATAAAAVGKLLVKAGGDFQELALRVGEFRDATGLAAEDASRFVELAGDLGIPVDTLQTAIGKLNRAAADTPEAFADINAEIARTRDGGVDVNQTFLNVVDSLNSIPDAAQRAAAAQKIFGRGWQQISELIGSGADDLKARLEGVGEGQIITDPQIAQARQFRDNLDDLNDGVEQVFNAIGSELIPVLNDLIGIAKAVGGAIAAIPFKEQAVELAGWVTGIKPLTMGLSKANEALEDLTGTTHGSIGAMASYKGELDDAELKLSQFEAAQQRAADATKDQYESASEAVDRLEALADAQQEAADAADEHRAAMQRLADNTFTAEGAMLAAEDAVAEFRSQLRETRDVLADSSSTARDKAAALNDLRQAEIRAAEEAINAAKAIADESGATEGSVGHTAAFRSALEDLAAKFPALRQEIDAYIARLNAIPTSKTTTINTIINPTIGGPIPRRASGGPVEAGSAYLVGEQGPELVVPSGSGQVFSASRTRSILSRRQRRAVRSNLGASENLAAQAAAARALAEATADAAEKEKLLDKANDLIERSAARAARASEILADRFGAEADALRERAERLRENAAAFAEAQRERAGSRLDAVSARLALEDERASAEEAFAHARRAFTTEGVTAEQRRAALNDAQQAALSLAEAAVERERERAEAAGREFTDVDAARVRQRTLEELARQGGPVGQAIQGLLRELNFPALIRELEAAGRREERAERNASKNEESADKLDKAAERFERGADGMERAFAGLLKAFGKGLLTREELEREIDKALAKIARGARGGRR